MDTQKYLARIGIDHQIKQTKDQLTQLQYHHVTEIPFENLDILNKVPLTLDPNKLYEKIVTRKRGGVCYELNGLFHFFLRHLGFSVTMVAATVNIEDKWFVSGTHSTNIVHLDGCDYLVDVGFGANTPRQPIPLTGEKVQDAKTSYYRIKPYSEEPNTFILEKKETDLWKTLYKFPLSKRDLASFQAVCHMTQHSAQSVFNKNRSIMIVTKQGRMMLKDDTLTIVDGLKKSKTKIAPTQMNHILKKHFKLQAQ